MKFTITAAGGAVLQEGTKDLPATVDSVLDALGAPFAWTLERLQDGTEITAEFIVDKILAKIGDGIIYLIHLANDNSAEIVTLAVVACGFGMMIGPMVGMKAGKWFGRAVGALWIGVIWRIVI